MPPVTSTLRPDVTAGTLARQHGQSASAAVVDGSTPQASRAYGASATGRDAVAQKAEPAPPRSESRVIDGSSYEIIERKFDAAGHVSSTFVSTYRRVSGGTPVLVKWTARVGNLQQVCDRNMGSGCYMVDLADHNRLSPEEEQRIYKEQGERFSPPAP